MIIVADASVLVAELIRVRGWALFRDAAISLFVAEEQWGETQYEIERRLRHLRERVLVPEEQIASIRHEIEALIDDHAIDVVERHAYGELEAIARRRIPRDPNNWPTVALALALGADILTEDHDFLGCGVATWTFETLRDELTSSWPR